MSSLGLQPQKLLVQRQRGSLSVKIIGPAADAASDESAALAALPQQTLARLILPLGDFSPDELSDLAEELQF